MTNKGFKMVFYLKSFIYKWKALSIMKLFTVVA